jgi:predicted phosphodiesterase
MAGKISNASIARKYREKHGGDMPTLKLARIMYKENPLLFTDVESARSALRVIEGKSGDTLRKQVKDKGFFNNTPRPLNPYNLPASDEDEYLPYILTGKKILVLSDIHVPYHSISALTAVFDYAKSAKPDTVVINGDLFDFHKLSKYTKDPRKRNFEQEIAVGAEVINLIKKHITENVIFKHGNHDERYQHYLWTKAGEIAGLEDFELHNILVKRCGPIITVTDKRIMKAGHLNIIHGHEFVGGAGVPASVAKSFYDKGKSSVLGGHHHQSSEFTVTDMNGNMTTAYSSGCLSELHPQYMPINKWCHGAACVTIDGDTFHVHNFRIDKGKIY